MNAVEIALLWIVTVFFLVITWRVSLKAGRYHGIYRFFSFESILILVLLNWRYWFDEPFAWHQIISWVLLIGSIVPAVEGFRLLRRVGRPEGQFENTTSLVKVGAYRYIRHPLYASLILLGLGIFFKQLSGIGSVLALVNVGAMVATARWEEKEMVDRFGSEYAAYMQETKMFIPRIF
jgi:protein-S-isoprenylcysteine O-methyltransferase Ste14